MKHFFVTVLSLFASAAAEIKLGLLSDTHLKMNYNLTAGNSQNWCGPYNADDSDPTIYPAAVMGRLGCDAP
jgi:hypothetical protein